MIRRLSDDVFEVDSQSQEGVVHRVEQVGGVWTCDCTGFKMRKTCSHIKIAEQELKKRSGGTGNKFKDMALQHEFEIKSAFHKSIRMGDMNAACLFGGWFAVLEGPAAVVNYVKRITFEETCNWKLFYKYSDSWLNSVKAITASRKAWECLSCRGFFKRQLLARKRAEAHPFKKGEKEDLEIKNLDDGYELMYRTLLNPELPKLFDSYMDLLKKKAEGRLPLLVAKHLYTRFDMMFLIQYLTGGIDEEECCYIDEKLVKSVDKAVDLNPDQLVFHDYTYDVHTAKGAELVLNNWEAISRGDDVEGIDLRWAGLAISRMWRELAVEKFGEAYKNVKWGGCPIDNELWGLAVNEDKGNKTFRKIEQKYGDLILGFRRDREIVEPTINRGDYLNPRLTAEIMEPWLLRLLIDAEKYGAEKVIKGFREGETKALARTVFDMMKNMERVHAHEFYSALLALRQHLLGEEVMIPNNDETT